MARSFSQSELTLERAKAGMSQVVKKFDRIDTDHKDYITRQQIKDVMKEGPSSRNKI
ncbi:hypothetical protein SAMN04515617_114153 [Collimonas sp. OK242]|jgi:hypothetical protein|uniref:hypothetical protein n=1 Tax=Collimonas sp. OK242 TaxID=1798195 RepID=UPI000894515C|nr:hypothetical protein [Collimonas sp. OK242]SDY45489.1 hypothetical protein SAMN04515617_114153 [Collimonas sp. OK242]